MDENNDKPSTSGLNGSSNNNASQRADMSTNTRFNCSSCKQHSLVPNKPVYYLPCLDVICHLCFERLKFGQPNHPSIICPTCKRETSRECIFDDFTYDKARKRCENQGCDNQSEDDVFTCCKDCNKFLCELCSGKHNPSHRLKDASTYIPLSSRCSTNHTPHRFAAFVCACRRYLCINCSQTHQCNVTMLTNVSSLIQQSVAYMSKVAENDKKMFFHYQKTHETIQARRRQIFAEFHNARSSLAHSVTRSASLLMHRYKDIREHLNMLQNTIINQLSTHEKMLLAEMQRLKDVIGLESQIRTTKEYNAIPFFSFVKAASAIASNSCKHQNYNIDQQIPMLNIRVEAKMPDLCSFLTNFGAIYVNNSLTKPKSKFDNMVMPIFDAVPKINTENNSKSFGYSLRMLDGKKHVVVDQEEVKRKVKRIEDPEELRIRCEQLENEVIYYKALAAHLESELENKRLPEQIPSTSKGISNNHQPNRPVMSTQQQQLLQQLKNHASLQNISQINKITNPHHTSKRQGMTSYTNSGLPTSPAMQFANQEIQSSLPGSPQLNVMSRQSGSSAQSPITPTHMIPPNLLFTRPPNVNLNEWRMQCLQILRQQAPNLPQFNTTIKNQMAQLSPFPSVAVPASTQQGLMQNSPQAVQSPLISRSGSIPKVIDTARISRESNNTANPEPVEVINLSDDEETVDTSNKKESSNGQSVHLEPPDPNYFTPNEISTNQSEASARTIRVMSEQNKSEERQNITKEIRASSVPKLDKNVNQTSATSITDEGPKSAEKPQNDSENGSHPPIKLRFRLGDRKLPVVGIDHSNSDKQDVGNESQKHDDWDDFCYVCNEGCDERTGELGCCSRCPRVFHQLCHIPHCPKPMGDLPDDWCCGVCVEIEPIREVTTNFSQNALLACSRVLLLCYKESAKVEVFRRAEYSKDTDSHINLFKIGNRLSRRTYTKISDFINDMNMLFINCSKFNAPNSTTAEYGRFIYGLYQDGVRNFLPGYTKEIWMYINLYSKSEVPRKKRKIME